VQNTAHSVIYGKRRAVLRRYVHHVHLLALAILQRHAQNANLSILYFFLSRFIQHQASAPPARKAPFPGEKAHDNA
jgi:hypothetical protein